MINIENNVEVFFLWKRPCTKKISTYPSRRKIFLGDGVGNYLVFDVDDPWKKGRSYLEAPLVLVRFRADLHLRLLVDREKGLVLTVVCTYERAYN